MRIWGTLLIVGMVCGLAFSEKETMAELADRAKAAPPDHQPELYIKAAGQELKLLTRLYDEGKVEDARAALTEVVSYSDHATDAAIQTRKRVKGTEIDLRKMVERLRDLKRTLNFEDQPPVQETMDHLEGLRTSLLALMFGKEKK
jgi:hypothetical protein